MAATLYYEKHPDKLADKCAREFPVKTDSARADSVYRSTGTTVVHDTVQGKTVFFDCDSAKEAARAAGIADGKFMIDCPDSYIDTVYKHDTFIHYQTTFVTKENTAALTVLQKKSDDAASAGIKQGQKLFFYKRASLFMLMLILAYVALRVASTWLSKYTWLSWIVKWL